MIFSTILDDIVAVVSDKPQIFATDTGIFTYECIVAIHHNAASTGRRVRQIKVVVYKGKSHRHLVHILVQAAVFNLKFIAYQHRILNIGVTCREAQSSASQFAVLVIGAPKRQVNW